jgi:uncharacterized protein YndB with AHSA1/START domain
MAAAGNITTEAAKHEIVVTRLFDAPRALVWKAWTQPEHMMRWWGPKGYTTPSCEMDVRPGGALRLCMRSSDGVDLWVRGVFREVVEPERLVFAAVNDADLDAETVIAVTLEDQGGKTLLTMRQTFAKPEVSRGAKEGWASGFERLAEYLATIS